MKRILGREQVRNHCQPLDKVPKSMTSYSKVMSKKFGSLLSIMIRVKVSWLPMKEATHKISKKVYTLCLFDFWGHFNTH